jgi:hypothetical protein
LEQVRVELVGLAGCVLAVAIDERAELVDVAAALVRHALALPEDVGLVAVRRTDFAEGSSQVVLCLVEQAEIVGEMHRQASGAAVASAADPPTVGGAADGSSGAGAPTVGAGDGEPPPAATFVTRTAATLKRGCFDTGSQAVIVTSFAARRWPSPSPGPVSGARSQYP